MRNLLVFSGSSHPDLTEAICARLGVEIAPSNLGKFSNAETNVEIRKSVRDQQVYIVQSGSGKVNDNFMELLIMISACKTASAKKVTVVLPYFPYSRQPDIPYAKSGIPVRKSAYVGLRDSPNLSNVVLSPAVDPTNKDKDSDVPTELLLPSVAPMSSISSILNSNISEKPLPTASPRIAAISQQKNSTVHDPVDNRWVKPDGAYKHWVARSGELVANLLIAAGADHIITMDLHDPQFQGYFDIPVDMISAESSILDYIRSKIPNYKDAVIVSPDAGGAKRATSVANQLNLDLALIHKEGKTNEVSRMSLVGDVSGKPVIIIDDIADTCGTLGLATELLHQRGATEIYAVVTHGILSGKAVEIINKSPLSQVVITNTVPHEEKKTTCSKLRTIDVSGPFAEAIRRIHNGETLAPLFKKKAYN
ncbi:phosphoribosyl pyrophosphokinase [Basidiobolus meristosporus CBS 931.73]|uniref:ribose-phosphate diphosphokinase n=1 Tax=Basidiobolus meristosporus CBS 931.73 TaxID=1314790 RepID=A0A1Y1Z882_9FUNG|nr:phosphoribosyl pyrophosphokinase [Basidiobolus meristosporus CBS 931.73]|eukprot:ORY06472.1 phosphoribosyl pyrophosphokinase [Basidiobolus meristosporus CBS 931.73]